MIHILAKLYLTYNYSVVTLTCIVDRKLAYGSTELANLAAVWNGSMYKKDKVNELMTFLPWFDLNSVQKIVFVYLEMVKLSTVILPRLLWLYPQHT